MAAERLTAAERVSLERVTTAYHEAAHAVAAILCGRPPDLVTIRPGDGTLGHMQWVGRVAGPAPAPLPIVMQPPALRAEAEAEIVTLLSGTIAQELISPHTGYGRSEGRVKAEYVADRLARTTPAHLALFDLGLLADGPETDPANDLRKARELSDGLAGAEGGAHFWLMSRVARRLVCESAVAIEHVAVALLERETLTGIEVSLILRPDGSLLPPDLRSLLRTDSLPSTEKKEFVT